ncbi:MAG: hypothetical protein ACRDL6_06810 [Solirubrobacterales bacterium]
MRLAGLVALATGALALSPSAASGALSLSPTSLSFSQPVGTTSTPQTATLTLACDGCFPADTFSPVIATTPGTFTQTNDCPPQLFVNFLGLPETDSCTINVAFAANTAGTVNGTLSTGPGGPTASLTGTGVAPPVSIPSSTPSAGGQLGQVKKCNKKKKKKKKKSAAAAKKRKGCKRKKKK